MFVRVGSDGVIINVSQIVWLLPADFAPSKYTVTAGTTWVAEMGVAGKHIDLTDEDYANIMKVIESLGVL